MKTKTNRMGIVLGMALMTSSLAFAQSAEQQYLSSDPININGYVQEELPPTDAELESVKGELRKQKTAIIVTKEKKKKYDQLSDSTEKLSEEMEELISERKEAQSKIDKYNKKIDCLMATGYKPGCEEYVDAPVKDEVKVKKAAPVVEAPAPAPETQASFGSEIKVLPYSGLMTFMSDNNNLESNITAGIKVETNVNRRFSVGLGFNYTSLTTTDFGGSDFFDPGFGLYYDSFYGGREIEYSNMNFNLYGKFFFLNNERFRPYVGAGLGYNRANMEYNDNNSAGSTFNGNFYNYNFGNEEVITSSINAELMAGSEIVFTDMIGMNLEISYMRGIGSNLSTENGIDPFFAPDQQRLEQLSEELSTANIVSLFAGMLIQF